MSDVVKQLIECRAMAHEAGLLVGDFRGALLHAENAARAAENESTDTARRTASTALCDAKAAGRSATRAVAEVSMKVNEVTT